MKKLLLLLTNFAFAVSATETPLRPESEPCEAELRALFSQTSANKHIAGKKRLTNDNGESSVVKEVASVHVKTATEGDLIRIKAFTERCQHPQQPSDNTDP